MVHQPSGLVLAELQMVDRFLDDPPAGVQAALLRGGTFPCHLEHCLDELLSLPQLVQFDQGLLIIFAPHEIDESPQLFLLS